MPPTTTRRTSPTRQPPSQPRGRHPRTTETICQPILNDNIISNQTTDLPSSLFDNSSLFLNDIDFLKALKNLHFNYLPCLAKLNQNQIVDGEINTDSSTTYTGVVNLSDHRLSDSEQSLLSKGLTFVHTPSSPDPGILSEDLSKFHRSLKRKLALDKLYSPAPGYTHENRELPTQIPSGLASTDQTPKPFYINISKTFCLESSRSPHCRVHVLPERNCIRSVTSKQTQSI